MNFDDVQTEFPEIDFHEFYLLAKQIYDEILSSDNAEWKNLVVLSLSCRSQINTMKSCIDESLSLNLTEVYLNQHGDFKALHEEIEKGQVKKSFIILPF